MPAFTFEKISPPPQRGPHRTSLVQAQARPQGSGSPQPRGTVIQVLGRFVEARVRDDERMDLPPPRKPLPK